MSTKNAEGLNFKIVSMGREEVDRRPPCNLRPINLDKLLAWIDTQVSDPDLREEVKKAAKGYPALGSFRRNFQMHLSRAQKKLRERTPINKPIEELGDEPRKEAGQEVPDEFN